MQGGLTGKLKNLFQRLADAGTRLRAEKGGDWHATHFHPHEIAQMAARDTQPPNTHRDTFKDKGVFQRSLYPARVDIGPPRHQSVATQGFPIGFDLRQRAIANMRPMI